MVDVVFVIFDPWRRAAERQMRLIGVQRPDFTGGLAAQRQQQLLFGAGAVAMQEEPPIRLVKNLFSGSAIEAIAEQFMRAMGVVEHAEKQGQAVVGPRSCCRRSPRIPVR